MTYTKVIGTIIRAGSSNYNVILPTEGNGDYALQINSRSTIYHSDEYNLAYFNRNIASGSWKIVKEPPGEVLYDIY